MVEQDWKEHGRLVMTWRIYASCFFTRNMFIELSEHD